jgi:hypothetical protein
MLHGGVASRQQLWRMVGIRTFSRCICLHEPLFRTGFLKLWGKPCQLGEVFVNEADLGCEVVVVDMFGEESSGVACAGSD